MTQAEPRFLAARYEALLAQRERELRATLDAADTARLHGDDPGEVVDQKDLAERDTQALFDDRLSANAAAELAQVAAARERLHTGRYGRCEACGEAVDEQRLLAQPAARLCASCQARHESRRA